MNILNPLVAALLMTASSALAGTAYAPTFSMFPNAAPSTFSQNGDVDMVEKCGTVPYRPCTDAELQERARRAASSGVCLPSDTACQSSFMTGAGATDPTETIAAYTPPPGTQWASPDCQRIPCRLVDSPGAPTNLLPDNWEETHQMLPPKTPTYGDGLIGPPAPTPEQRHQANLAEARKGIADGSVKDVIDLGNGEYAMIFPEDPPGAGKTASVCTNAQCAMPVPVGQIDNSKVAAWVANDRMTDGSAGGGGMAAFTNPAPLNPDKSSRTGSGAPGDTTPQPVTPVSSRGGLTDGAEIAAAQNTLNPGSSFGASDAGAMPSGMATSEDVVWVPGEGLDTTELTFTKNIQVSKTIKTIGMDVNAAFNTTNGNRLANPPTCDGNGCRQGDIQAVSNK